ncbi:MAG TPA: helix-turn-helix domain-containing protein [Ilumatobacter sp.]|nr:helix-turn-helix domain-containing protein [Ilumatobacter sp.]
MSEWDTPSRPVGPVHRAFALLQLVVAADEPIGARELARRSGVSKSTAARMLGILAELGMVERNAAGAARPGAGLTTLTRRVGRSPAVLRQLLRPLTAELQRTYDENAAVGIDDGDGFLYLDSARSSTAVQVADPAGDTFAFHVVAPGLMAMAAWTEERLEAYLVGPLAAPTDRSVVDPAAIRARVSRARRDGFVWTDQELDLDVNGVAVPIHDGAGRQVAVATLYGPAYRLNAGGSPDLGPRLAAFVAERAAGLLAG